MAANAQTTTRVSRVLMGLAVLWSIIGLTRHWASADIEDRQNTLRGLVGVTVITSITSTYPGFAQAGPLEKQLQTEVELQLRQMGIPVFTITEVDKVPGHPSLVVMVHIHQGSFSRQYFFTLSVDILQDANLARDPSKGFLTSTWESRMTGVVEEARVTSYLRQSVKDQAAEFINAYFRVNHRPAGSVAPSSLSPWRDLIREVQERLQTVGYNPGTIDGTMGPQTQQALRWFQNAQGLRATGELDELTLNALDIK